jgi:hypothetical protein
LATSIPFLDILYTLTALALFFGSLSELVKGNFKFFLKLFGAGIVILALELIVIGWLIYHWSFAALLKRYVTEGIMLIPYLIREYF